MRVVSLYKEVLSPRFRREFRFLEYIHQLVKLTNTLVVISVPVTHDYLWRGIPQTLLVHVVTRFSNPRDHHETRFRRNTCVRGVKRFIIVIG